MLNYDCDRVAGGNSVLDEEIFAGSWERAYPIASNLLAGVLDRSARQAHDIAKSSAGRRPRVQPKFQPERISGLCASS